jgi:hypothetical protein
MKNAENKLEKGGKKNEEEVSITPIQIFVLTYLYSEEVKETQKKEIIDNILQSNKSKVSEFSHHVSISLRDISLLVPSSVLPEIWINEEYIYNQMKILEYNHLLIKSIDDFENNDNTSYFITIDGIILVKQIFSSLSDNIQDEKIFPKDIDNLEGNRETKEWLKELWSNVEDTAKDDIADMVIDGVKIYGPPAIVLLINLLSYSAPKS